MNCTILAIPMDNDDDSRNCAVEIIRERSVWRTVACCVFASWFRICLLGARGSLPATHCLLMPKTDIPFGLWGKLTRWSMQRPTQTYCLDLMRTRHWHFPEWSDPEMPTGVCWTTSAIWKRGESWRRRSQCLAGMELRGRTSYNVGKDFFRRWTESSRARTTRLRVGEARAKSNGKTRFSTVLDLIELTFNL